ncbi:MAG: nitrite reductase large subunit NirB [Pseudomonadota bacterium]
MSKTDLQQSKPRILVVGNGMVGHHFVDQLAQSEHCFDITVLGAEHRYAYDRVHLSDVFAGSSAETLALGNKADYEQAGIDVVLGAEVETVSLSENTATTVDGRCFHFDQLVLATGSYPFVPPIPGSDQIGCFVYRTIDDLDLIQNAAKGAKRGVVVGGGLLGLECANALKNLGLETHVVEFAPGLMGVQLDQTGSGVLREHIEALDVVVHTERATQSISRTSDGALLMQFADGDELQTDLIVFSAGIRPNDRLALNAGIEVGERGGIVVDKHCRTSAPNVFAIGECALYENRIFGLVAPGYRMAETVVGVLGAKDQEFLGSDMSTKLKLLGVEVGSIGDAHANTPGTLSYSYSDPVKKIYRRMNVSADGKRVTGAVLVGDCDPYDQLLQYFLNEIKLPNAPEDLLLPATEGGAGLSSQMLPDTAQVCSCHNVSKGDVISCMDAGMLTLPEIKAETKASTGCGGCAALLKSIVDEELDVRGIEVDKSICEHFPYSRQELFHLCKVEGIKDMATLLDKHGRGFGCDICKPAAASIFATLYNEYVLSEQHAALQDTNDYMLANMQKNGTYSVVPRVPGGEITPDKLIAIGEIAKKYDLYTKITGGQRIDLFGAEVHELPEIWSQLIDAGFETGHAYGKAMRTVKSCVGSTWCRYGVQDSVAMALYIENRYKGLRSPHKLKLAVSGCTRECAEAQSKDVGVIATEKGWNLYVGGNGGMRPRHAELFATDLDDETLIRYIDRFLMFYVKTADRLQRTSVWMENLEGGLDYLTDVVIDDSLGIADELEEQMELIVGTYQCEWKTTIEDPEKLKRFKSFVNVKEPDPEVIFVRERGQIRPATDHEKERDVRNEKHGTKDRQNAALEAMVIEV